MASLKLVICHFLYSIPLHVLMLKFISVPVKIDRFSRSDWFIDLYSFSEFYT